ncbi:hypothetical protein [Marinobacter sp. W-8]|uniref:hypothetical protein n=1 Tax=Marinobacter sp. W-8 TaxID=3369658 RepID=UPI0037C6DBD8
MELVELFGGYQRLNDGVFFTRGLQYQHDWLAVFRAVVCQELFGAEGGHGVDGDGFQAGEQGFQAGGRVQATGFRQVVFVQLVIGRVRGNSRFYYGYPGFAAGCLAQVFGQLRVGFHQDDALGFGVQPVWQFCGLAGAYVEDGVHGVGLPFPWAVVQCCLAAGWVCGAGSDANEPERGARSSFWP